MDEGAERTSSIWGTSGDTLIQSSNVGGGTAVSYPDTYALAGDAAWTDYILTLTLASKTDDGAIGVIFRYKDF